MSAINIKRVVIALLVIWIVTSVYLWFPEIIALTSSSKESRKSPLPEEFHFREENGKSQRENSSNFGTAHVCITSDKNTLGGMMTLINSIHSNTKYPVKFHLVTDDASVNHARAWIAGTKLNTIDYEIKPFPEELVHGKIKVRGGRKELASPLNYARYFLPQLFPKINDRLVFIDDDSVVQGDIHQLYNMKFKPGTWAAFSEDCMGASKRLTHMQNVYADFIDFKNKHILELDYKPNACSFNTGVYVADINVWKKYNVTAKLTHWLELNTKEEVYGNERGGGGSQPPMMLVFYEKYTPIDPNWHVRNLGLTARTSYSKQALTHANLLHWNGRFKPWGHASQHSHIWDKYYIPDPIGKFRPVRKNKDSKS